MVPAVGQGALAIETRDEESTATELCAKLHDEATGIAVRAERALLAALGGGCQVPIGAHARVEGVTVHLDGIVIAPDGSRPVRGQEQGPIADADAVGRRLGEALLEAGADEILEEVYGG